MNERHFCLIERLSIRSNDTFLVREEQQDERHIAIHGSAGIYLAHGASNDKR